MKALELALDSTRRYGNAIVGVKGSNHFGICSFYLNQAVKHNVIMMIVSNAPKTMPPSVEKQLDTWGKRFQLDLREALV
jgi:LDH2 family malate/lactate/ureidoglycolate dehydrogenase